MNLLAILLWASALVVLAGPLLFGLRGWLTRPDDDGRPIRAISPPLHLASRTCIASTLSYALAFNLVFLWQEIFLVLPKALTPGLTPTLYHNNHTWAGEHTLASLFQGTGALATSLLAVIALFVLRRKNLSVNARLVWLWIAYHGLFMALSQLVIGAFNPRNDVGMAMEYFALSPAARLVVACAALAALPPLALLLVRCLMESAPDAVQVGTRTARTCFAAIAATVPAVLGTLLLVPFRLPNAWAEVLLFPAIIAIAGIGWMQAGAWYVSVEDSEPPRRLASVMPVAIALLLTLVLFQGVLRNGITF